MEAKRTNKITSTCKINTGWYHQKLDPACKKLFTRQFPTECNHFVTHDEGFKSPAEQIAGNIISLATSVKSDESCEFASGLKIKTDKLDDKGTKVNEVLHRKCVTINLLLLTI